MLTDVKMREDWKSIRRNSKQSKAYEREGNEKVFFFFFIKEMNTLPTPI